MVKIIYKVKEVAEEHKQEEGRTFSWMAEKMGLSKQNFYKFLRKDKYYLDELLSFADILDIKIEDLYRMDKHD